MADWQMVRFDPAYEEKLDPEIIPLCDALNAAGFVTTASCCGHGYSWPCVWFEHSIDERIESMARFVLQREPMEDVRYFSIFRKEVRLDGYIWSLQIHLVHVYFDTPPSIAQQEAEIAMTEITQAIRDWQKELNI